MHNKWIIFISVFISFSHCLNCPVFSQISFWEIDPHISFSDEPKQMEGIDLSHFFQNGIMREDDTQSNAVSLTQSSLFNESHAYTYLTLQDAIEFALINNPTLTLYKNYITIAKHDLTIANGEYDWDVSYGIQTSEGIQTSTDLKYETKWTNHSLSLQKKWLPGTITEISIETDTDEYKGERINEKEVTNQILLSLTQPILKGFGVQINASTIQTLTHAVKQEQNSYISSLQDVLLSVLTGYLAVVSRYKTIQIHQAAVTNAYDVLRLVNKKLLLGKAIQSDLVQVMTSISLAREEVIQSTTDYEKAVFNLLFLIDSNALFMNQDFRIIPSTRLDASSTVSLEPYCFQDEINEAFTNRNDLKNLMLQLKNDDIDIMISKNNLLPDVILFGNSGYRAFDDTFNHSLSSLNEKPYWRLGLRVDYPIGNRTAQSAYQKSIITKAQTHLLIEDLKHQIMRDVRKAISDVKNAYHILINSRETKAYADDQYERELARFHIGLSTIFVINQLRIEKSKSDSNLYQNYINYLISLMQLERVKGTLLKAQFKINYDHVKMKQ